MEEWGRMIVKAPKETLAHFAKGNIANALAQLANYAGIDSKAVEHANAIMDTAELKEGYLTLLYDCSEWVDISMAFVSKGSNIEYYARHGDEYGTLSFFALTASSERFCLQFDEGGDAMEDEAYQEKMIGKLNQWKSLIPQSVKKTYPDFAAINAEDYIY